MKVEGRLNFEVVSVAFSLRYLSQNFIGLSMWGVLRNPHNRQISGLSFGFNFDRDLTLKGGKGRCRKVKVALYVPVYLHA